jgi:hypothetical protein
MVSGFYLAFICSIGITHFRRAFEFVSMPLMSGNAQRGIEMHKLSVALGHQTVESIRLIAQKIQCQFNH